MSFQTSIPHRPQPTRWCEVKCTLQWSLSGHQHVCISYSQEHIKRQLKKTSNRRSSQLTQYLSYILLIFFWQKEKKYMLVLGSHSIDRKSTGDEANIGNPKLKRGCPPLTANHISADCEEASLGPVQYIPMGVYHTGGSNAMYSTQSTTVWIFDVTDNKVLI